MTVVESFNPIEIDHQHLGSPELVIPEIVAARIGIGVFNVSQLNEVYLALDSADLSIAKGMRTSTVGAGSSIRYGELHRHGDGGLIVHTTREGSGPAQFYWPVYDKDGYMPEFDFIPSEDRVVGAATNVRIHPEVVVVFPTNTWHQFGADPHTVRRSTHTMLFPS